MNAPARPPSAVPVHADPRPADVLRAAAVLTSAAAQILVIVLGPRFGQERNGEVSRRYPTLITPPDVAFAIWFPIFTGCTISALRQARPAAMTSAANRTTGWPLAAAYATTAVWSLVEQSGRFRPTAAILPVIVGFTGTAFARLQGETGERHDDEAGAERLLPSSVGLLLGWTTLASVVNIAAVARANGADQTSPRIVSVSAAAAIATGGTIAEVIARSTRGFTAVAAAATWGLGTVAGTSPSRPVRAAATIGALAVAGTTAAKLLKPRRASRVS